MDNNKIACLCRPWRACCRAPTDIEVETRLKISGLLEEQLLPTMLLPDVYFSAEMLKLHKTGKNIVMGE